MASVSQIINALRTIFARNSPRMLIIADLIGDLAYAIIDKCSVIVARVDYRSRTQEIEITALKQEIIELKARLTKLEL